MLKKYKLFQRLSLVLTPLMLADGATAAIYRPTCASGVGDPISLANNVNTAIGTLNDDIVDLGGCVYVFTNSCDDFVVPPSGCNTTTGLNALPVIPSATTAGKLSIINGTILRSAAEVVPAIPNFRFLSVASGADLSLFNITLDNGRIDSDSTGATDSGGAIYNLGNLKIQNSTLQNNYANDLGGAIYNGATPGTTTPVVAGVPGVLDIQSSLIAGNTANDASLLEGGGGGIFNANVLNEDLTRTSAKINSINNSTISGNITPGFGAGINNQGSANNIINSTISENFACDTFAGGICPDPTTGTGGGIYNDGFATLLVVVNSTISGNTAYQGGGIFNNSISVAAGTYPNFTAGTHLYNNTISRNIVNVTGGGILNNENSNNGNVVAVISNLWSNIIAGNIDTLLVAKDFENFDVGLVLGATISSWGFNLVGDNSGVTAHIFPGDTQNDIAGTSSAPIDPKLGNLQDNGGFTFTLALLPDSPAINNGLNPLLLKYDQRGIPFNRVRCSRPDIGAFELQDCFNSDL